MRIKQTSGLRDIKGSSGSSSTAVKRSSNSPFAASLIQKENEYDDYRKEIEELKQGIDEAGEKLENEPNLDNFQRFRDLLSKIAKRISAEAYRLNKIGGTPQNPRYYEIITVINAEADQLYRLLVNEQRDRMAITAKVIGIKGLVVNLTT